MSVDVAIVSDLFMQLFVEEIFPQQTSGYSDS